MKIIKIVDDFMTFEVRSIKYMIDITNLVDYVKYYYLSDCVVGDVDDIFKAIIEIAENRDMFSLIKIFKHLEEKELGHKYLILNTDGSIDGFSDIFGLSYIIDIIKIIDDMDDEDKIEEYCERIE